MSQVWVTTSSNKVEPMVNSINAACEEGFVPDKLHFMKNPGVEAVVEEAIELTWDIIEAYDGEEPTVSVTELDDELEFERIKTHVISAVTDAVERGDEVAVDFTPGRKFMSAFAFAGGMNWGADHVYYFYVISDAYHGLLYPEIPRTAVTLYDFTELM